MAISEFQKRQQEREQQMPDLLPPEGQAGSEEQQARGDARFSGSREDWSRNGGEVVHAQRLARALGWFSLGLGVTEIIVPGTIARVAGMDGKRGVIRALGIREIAHGVGILSRRKPTGWLWSRVFGDVIDLVVLGKAAAVPDANKIRLAAAAATVAGVTVLDFNAGRQLTRVADDIEDDFVHATHAILIGRPAEEIYKFWRDFKNLPQIMDHLKSVDVIDDRHSRWVAKGPAGKRIEWQSEISADRPNELIAWSSIEGSSLENSGSVSFEQAPGGRGTLVRVELTYFPPGGPLGATIARLLGEEPRLQLKDDLRHLKQLLETGEVVTTEGQSAGRAKSTSWKYDRLGRRLAAAF